ncbi:hypothetical protein DLAC_00595 [Tieghemostelium lacteum]|uniref:Tenascin X n=1 Tax=Tieghemostelium lacteum TaxID=361077 RepID=A0A152AA48_TIELA|nr:hypothetical protein DLAC_00595 [Tieghemostelium lacteum]|eukprot:KYR03102.1 hypothetical protein DLAC_00595 [Tieghemostelium lacteum]
MVTNSESVIGYVYVIYGSKSPFKARIDSFDGINGFKIIAEQDQAYGILYSSFGVGKVICDVNGDGVKDLVISTYMGFYGGSSTIDNRIFVMYGLKNGTKFITDNIGEIKIYEIVAGKGFKMTGLYALTLTCGDINNDGYDDLYLLKPNSQIVFGKATFPLNYAPKFDGKEALNITGITWASIDNRSGTSSFGDFNGDGLIDMAVTNGSGSKAYNCDSLMMGDINADGFDDLQCFSPDFVWVVYGSDLPFESVVDLSATTSPLVDECRGLILEQVDGRVLANADFNNDKILDLMVVKSNVIYGIYSEKLPLSASLGLMDTILKYSANGSYILLEDNYRPVSGKCPLTSIKVQVINAQPSDSIDLASSNYITVKKLSPSTIIIYNNNRDSKFLQKIAKITYSTQRNDSFATINFKYSGYLNETIWISTVPIIPQTNVVSCICPANNTCIDSLCVPPGTTDINAGCAKYPCTYGLECNSSVNKCVLPSDCMSCADLKCGSNEKCELRKSRNAKSCKLFPFCLPN